MGWDGENRRAWVQDGAGRREYTYGAWGRVLEQRGYCGSSEGIEVVAVAAQYDAAGRKRFEKELRVDGSVVRTIESTYDALGRLQSIGDYRGTVVYVYDNATGRLEQEVYPNGSSVEYTYYGADTPSQVGFVWKVEHKKSDGSLLIGYEYTYDLLGRVVQSVERPSGDVTTYAYTPAGRLESEGRTGQVAYSRTYAYNPDGSRAMVIRDDVVHGSHWDFYSYDAVSGRLASVEDVWTGEVNSFVWNAEGTLARWETKPNGYARVFGYDEEGRLARIERDDGGGSLQLAYEYGYNSDGVKVLERKYITPQHWQEYRLLGCGSGCTGGTLSLYARERVSGQEGTWRRAEEYVSMAAGLIYRVPQSTLESPISFVLLHMNSGYVVHYPDGQIAAPYYTDSMGMEIGGIALSPCAEKRDWEAGCLPYPVVPVPDMPPPVYLPPYELPRTKPGDYESPLPGPWDDFKEAVDCSSNTLDADRLCRPSPEYEDEYQIWCENHPFCVGNSLCCHQRCMEHVLGHRWDEFVWRWIEFYEDVIERVPRCIRVR